MCVQLKLTSLEAGLSNETVVSHELLVFLDNEQLRSVLTLHGASEGSYPSVDQCCKQQPYKSSTWQFGPELVHSVWAWKLKSQWQKVGAAQTCQQVQRRLHQHLFAQAHMTASLATISVSLTFNSLP